MTAFVRCSPASVAVLKGERQRCTDIVKDELSNTNAEWFAKRILARIDVAQLHLVANPPPR